MGSTGTGRFHDYRPERIRRKKARREGSSEGGGDAEVEDRCAEPVEARLENVERCTYFRNHGDVPPPGTDVELSKRTNSGRLAVVVATSREIVGHLPTRLNYLISCMKKYSYEGEVTTSSTGKVARVTINLTAVS